MLTRLDIEENSIVRNGLWLVFEESNKLNIFLSLRIHNDRNKIFNPYFLFYISMSAREKNKVLGFRGKQLLRLTKDSNRFF